MPLNSVSKILFAIFGHDYKRKNHEALQTEWRNYKSRVPVIFQKWEKSGRFSTMMKIELSVAHGLCRVYQTSASSVTVNWPSPSYSAGAILPVAEVFLRAPLQPFVRSDGALSSFEKNQSAGLPLWLWKEPCLKRCCLKKERQQDAGTNSSLAGVSGYACPPG